MKEKKLGHGSQYAQKWELAILALLTEKNLGTAAKKVGISEATLWRWMQMPEFDEQYQKAKRQVFSNALDKLQQASFEAVQALKEIITDTDCQPAPRVSACRAILEFSTKGIETNDLLKRIEELEETVKTMGREQAV